MEKQLIIQSDSAIGRAKDLKIESDKDMRVATEVLSQVNQQLDALKAYEKKEIKPLNDIIKAKRKEIKPFKTKLEAAVKSIRVAMSDYQTKLEAKAQEQKEKIAARMGHGKGKLKPDTVSVKLAEVDTPDAQVETESGSVSFVTDYEVIVHDLQQVPWEYLKVELRKADAKKALKDGVEISGLELREIKVPKNKR